jgi:hypothetical protein
MTSETVKFKSKWKILQAARPNNFEFFMYRIIICLKEVISYDETVDSIVLKKKLLRYK